MSLLDSIKKKYGKSVTSGEIQTIQRIKTSVPGLDYLLGGGLPIGRVIEIYGPEDVGKTVTSLTLIKSAQEQGINCAFIDAERKLNFEFAASLGVSFDKLLVLKPAYGEQAFEFISDCGDSGIGLIIIDSIPMLTPKSTAEKQDVDPSKVDMASISNMYNRLKEYLVRTTNEKDICVVGLNQVRPRMDGYPGWNVPGGQALKHVWSIRLELSKDSTATKERLSLYEDPEDTKAVKVTCKKNHTARRVNKTTYIDIGPKGIDQVSSLVDLAIELNIVTKAGPWYIYKDNKIQGRNKLLTTIKSNQGIFDEIYAAVLSEQNYTQVSHNIEENNE